MTAPPSAGAGKAQFTGVRPWQGIRAAIDLPAPTAVWVLGVHLLTIASPLLLIAVVAPREAALSGLLDRPGWLYASAGCFIVASVCESAQNTLDRWYLVGVPPSLLDLCFNTLVVAGLGSQVIAVAGDSAIAWAAAVVLTTAFMLAYLVGLPIAPVQAVAGLSAGVLLVVALDQPVVLLSLATVALTLYFLDILVRTQQQAMHGFVTGVNAFSVVALSAGVVWAVDGGGWLWWQVVLVGVIAVAVPVGLRPWLLRLPPTPRGLSAS